MGRSAKIYDITAMMNRCRTLILLLGLLAGVPSPLNAQASPAKSIITPEKSYGQHTLVSFGYIRSRSLPLSMELEPYAPFARRVHPDSSRQNRELCIRDYYSRIRRAFREQRPDRAYVSDSLSMSTTDEIKGFRLFTQRTRRYDKLKRIRYALKKGIPVLVGFRERPPFEALLGQSLWEGEGSEGPHVMVITGYDQKLATFQLLNTYGQAWGESGFILMTYQDLLQRAAEVLTLEDPTRAPNRPSGPEPEIELSATAEVFQVDVHGDLQPLQAIYDTAGQVYRLRDRLVSVEEDQFQLRIHLPKGRCAYLFNVHPGGHTTPAWQTGYTPRDTTVVLPPVSYYRFPDPGKEYYVLLVSYKPIPFWRRYVEYVERNETDSRIRDKVTKAFERYLIPSSQTRYEGAELAVRARSTDRDQITTFLLLEWTIPEKEKRQ